jgi:predicted metal-dependent hydrolase
MPSSTPGSDRAAAASAKPLVRVVRSPRRRKTVTAYRDGDTVVVLLPSRLSRREEAHWVTTMLARLEQRDLKRRPAGDKELERRARLLNARYLDAVIEPASVRWVSNMRSRYGSCTPDNRTIRLSDRIALYPAWVRDYVLVHELAHLQVPSHSPEFWALVARYPLAERARGFLIAKGMDEEGSADPDGA